MALPYPGMDFTALDVLHAADLDKMVANIEYVNRLVDNKFLRLDGNATSYTADIYMYPGKGDTFIHQFIISVYNNTPQTFQVMWTKNTSVRKCANLSSGNLTATVTLNSFSEANATANITVTLSAVSYGGAGIISLG